MTYQIMLIDGTTLQFPRIREMVETEYYFLLKREDDREMYIMKRNIVYLCEI